MRASWGRSRVGRVLAQVAVVAIVGLGVSGAAGPAVGQPRPPRCEPVSDRDRVALTARIDTGQYTMTVVATAGPSAGASVRGSLWLSSMAAVHDSAVAAGASDPIAVPPHVPLFGATDVDLAGVSAPVATTGDIPSPHSFDPRRPGVVVWRDADSSRGIESWRLYVASVRNTRLACDRGAACRDQQAGEGPGIVFDVHKVDAMGFAGAWRAVSAGAAQGYFCAAPVHYYSRYKSRDVARPPRPH